MKRFVTCLLWLALSCLAGRAETYRFDPSKSLIEIHLGTAGAFGFLGHDHLIQTALRQGSFLYDPQQPSQSSVEVVVDARALRVMDAEISARDRNKIQATMESDRVLGIQQFPSITFKSTQLKTEGNKQLLVFGNLTIRGHTRPIALSAQIEETEPRFKAGGKTQFKLTEFGIKPVSAVGGTVKVRDLLTVTFQVVGDPIQK